MPNFGEAFRILRTVKNIIPKQVAVDLECDEKTIRDIESGKSRVISKRFQQLCEYYKVDPGLVLSLALGKISLSDILHDPSKGEILHNHIQHSENDVRDKYIALLEKQVEQLHARVEALEGQNG